ncbi:MAG: VWA domain-containing protein [Novosphingobium sp.]|nr:VWA domain-containing protein [Novosphingobium sp.]
MTIHSTDSGAPVNTGLMHRLATDRAGNTFAMVAAAILPLLAMVGGGVDMGRSYLSESRLQQACDAGVLAARKKLGSAVVADGVVPDDVATTGSRFFNINFRNGAYGTENRTFTMTLEEDYSISGAATVDVPTSIMHIFGTDNVPISVDCEARLNFSNTDVMLVLDTTGSMAETNPGDEKNRLESLKDTVTSFHAQLEASKSPGTRIRYGFVPYTTNVNVGALLHDDWIETNWNYQSRKREDVTELSTVTYTRNWANVSGSQSEVIVHQSYPATWHPGGAGSTYIDENENLVTVPAGSPYYTCDNPTPADTLTNNDILLSTATEAFIGPPVGTRVIQYRKRTLDGLDYWQGRNGATCNIYKRTYGNFVQTYERVTDPTIKTIKKYRYKQWGYDVSNWRTETAGCIEERDTYEIDDYDNVDLSKALDLDLDLVPTNNPKTKWKPAYPQYIFARSKKYNNTGTFTKNQVHTGDEYINPDSLGLSACPAVSRKLSEMDATQVSDYLATLYPTGQTYHDIGMIWGGRLISPTGLFGAENGDIDGKVTSRHLIFLTDGETAPLDLAYSAYGLEPLDERRWTQSSALSLTATVENRFLFACQEVKKRNVTIWLVGFGTTMTDTMKACAGNGHWFQADNAAQLTNIFSDIARKMGELRISK